MCKVFCVCVSSTKNLFHRLPYILPNIISIPKTRDNEIEGYASAPTKWEDSDLGSLIYDAAIKQQKKQRTSPQQLWRTLVQNNSTVDI
jgi:hypothetical protein